MGLSSHTTTNPSLSQIPQSSLKTELIYPFSSSSSSLHYFLQASPSRNGLPNSKCSSPVFYLVESSVFPCTLCMFFQFTNTCTHVISNEIMLTLAIGTYLTLGICGLYHCQASSEIFLACNFNLQFLSYIDTSKIFIFL